MQCVTLPPQQGDWHGQCPSLAVQLSFVWSVNITPNTIDSSAITIDLNTDDDSSDKVVNNEWYITSVKDKFPSDWYDHFTLLNKLIFHNKNL